MLTEYEVRLRVIAIRTSKVSPMKKFRALLQLSRALSRQARDLGRTRSQILDSGDRRALSVIQRLLARTQVLLDDVRSAARETMLSSSNHSIGLVN